MGRQVRVDRGGHGIAHSRNQPLAPPRNNQRASSPRQRSVTGSRLAERTPKAHTQSSQSYPEVVMPVTSPPMGSNVPPTPEPGRPLDDPRALEEYFRAHFSELTTEAKSQLDDAGSSA